MHRALLALLLVASQPVAAAEWDRALWDPGAPVDGQLALPLPCGGAMAFVRVETPVAPNDPLADREIRIGGASMETGYLDYYRRAHLRGSFSDGERIFFYVAKYEVTRDQWAAVMADGCPELSRGGARPAGGVSWFDAIRFTRLYTEWLRSAARDALPAEQEVAGYVRLPTEVEWEYAARGGPAVDPADFRGTVPPMEEELGAYAWFQGRRSANGAYRPIGMKRPNPLGLHEMFGSVEEIVLDPFRLNNLGRLHGQVGGFVTRGGSIETPGGELRSSLRAEWPFFDAVDGRATAFESFGLRPVISAPVNTSLARTTRIRDLWQERASAAPEAEADPLAVLDDLAERETDKRLLEELAFVRSEVVADQRAREEAAARALRLSLLNGAVVLRWLRQEHDALGRLDAVVSMLERILANEQASLGEIENSEAKAHRRAEIAQRERQLNEQRDRLEQSRSNFQLAASAYLAALIEIDEDHPSDVVRDQASRLIVELDERSQERLAPAVELFVANIERRDADTALGRDAMLRHALP